MKAIRKEIIYSCVRIEKLTFKERLNILFGRPFSTMTKIYLDKNNNVEKSESMHNVISHTSQKDFELEMFYPY